MADDVILRAMNDLKTRVQSIATANGITSVELCLSVDDLDQQVLGVPPPAVGIMYAGQASYRMATHGAPKRSHNIGLATKARFSIVIATASKSVFGAATTPDALGLLKAIRDVVKDTPGPSNHFWDFISEVPAADRNEKLLWMQNWDLPVILAGP